MSHSTLRRPIPTPPSSTDPIAAGRDFVLRGRIANKGVRCPCCSQKVKLYRRKLTRPIAEALCYLVREHQKTGGWVDVVTNPPLELVRNRETGKLQYWGLAETQTSSDGRKTFSGMWRPTPLGIQFAKGMAKVKEYAFVYNGSCEAVGGREVSVRQVLGGKGFNLSDAENTEAAGE